MIPHDQTASRPEQLVLYQRGTIPGLAFPGPGTTIVLPIVSSAVVAVGQEYNNFEDNSSFTHLLRGGTHGLRRVAGLFWLDLFLFSDQDSTLELEERTFDEIRAGPGLAGFIDTFRTVWTRPATALQPFRQTWRLMNIDSRITFTNTGAGAVTTFDFTAILRAA